MNVISTMVEIVRARPATPAFSSAPVSEEDLQQILRAGLEAPSSYNMRPGASWSCATRTFVDDCGTRHWDRIRSSRRQW